jgi:hypothetical protein
LPAVKALALLVLAALVAGCGSASYTRHDFVAQANAICAGALRKTRSIVPTQSGGGQLAVLSGYLKHAVPIVRSEANQLHALKRPPGSDGERALLASYFQELDKTVASYTSLAAAAKRRDAQAAANAEAALRASRATSLATRYGLRSCGTPTATTA